MSDKSIKGISLWQPWGTLMEMGVKTNETRSWYTSYRGPLAILAAKKWGWEFHQTCRTGAFKEVLSPRFDLSPGKGGRCPKPLPLGVMLCVVDLVDCVQITSANTPDGYEREFGDYTPGRYMWRTKNLRVLPKPIPWIGAQGLFEVPLAVADLFALVGDTANPERSLFEQGRAAG